MEKYELLEKLECVKINLGNSMCNNNNVYFKIGIDQLTELIEQVEKSDEAQQLIV